MTRDPGRGGRRRRGAKAGEWEPEIQDGAPVTLEASLDRYLKHLGAPSVAAVSGLPAAWASVVGPGLAAHTRPGDISSGVLVVYCDDSTWASQIKWQQRQIAIAIDEHFPDTGIDRVRTVVKAR